MPRNPFNPEPQWHRAGAQDSPRDIAEGWLTDPRPDDGGEVAAARLRRYRPNLAKKVLAWISVATGVVCLLPVVFPETSYGV